jgi:Fungal specific transcription factor domain
VTFTQINSQYCTNPIWLSAAIASTCLFNITLFACSIHDAALRGKKESPESIFYKTETIRNLNECLGDPDLAVADETLAAVLLLTHIVVCSSRGQSRPISECPLRRRKKQSIIGQPIEVETHIKGLQQMINLRGGIENYTLGGVFLHMLCTCVSPPPLPNRTNHLTAVFSEVPTLHPSICPYTPAKTLTPCCAVSVHESPLLKPFAISSGFHTVMVDLLHDMGYLYAVLDVFTCRFLPHWRGGFENVVANIEQMATMEDKLGGSPQL